MNRSSLRSYVGPVPAPRRHPPVFLLVDEPTCETGSESELGDSEFVVVDNVGSPANELVADLGPQNLGLVTNESGICPDDELGSVEGGKDPFLQGTEASGRDITGAVHALFSFGI